MEEIRLKRDVGFARLRSIDPKQEGRPIDSAALSEFWLMEDDRNATSLEPDRFLERTKDILNYSVRCRRAGDRQGMLFALQAIGFGESLIGGKTREPRLQMLRTVLAAGGHVGLDLAMHFANNAEWHKALHQCAVVSEIVSKLESMSERGYPEKLAPFLPGKLVSVLSGTKARAWLFGTEGLKNRVMTPLQALAKFQSLDPPTGDLRARQIDALQIAKVCVIYEPDLLPSISAVLRDQLGITIPRHAGKWRLYVNNPGFADEPHAFPQLELEIYRGLVEADMTEQELLGLIDVRKQSMEVFFGPNADLTAVHAADEVEIPFMLARCRKAAASKGSMR